MLLGHPYSACACLLRLVAAAALVGAGPSSHIYAQGSATVAPTVSDQALTAEQLSVYRPILNQKLHDSITKVNLVDETSVFKMNDDAGEKVCLNGLELEPYNAAVVHRFRTEDLAQLKLKGLRLVEEAVQEKEVEKNDPSKAIRGGSSVDSAVRNGFAHGYFWLSEIRFDKSHTHAMVSYGFRCGGLCGSGGTVILEKTNDLWTIRRMCSVWMS